MAYEDTCLSHHGVKGMKWGIRRNPEKALERANKRFNRYTKKAGDYAIKSAVLGGKAAGLSMRRGRASTLGRSRNPMLSAKRIRRLNNRSVRANIRYQRYKEKARRQAEKIAQNFGTSPQTSGKKKAEGKVFVDSILQNLRREIASDTVRKRR